MLTQEEYTARTDAADSLERMQNFDVAQLAREEELGRALSFKEAVAPARRLVELYQRLSLAALEDFPVEKLQAVRNVANQDYSLFDAILKFSAEQGNPQEVRRNYIAQLLSAYPQTFNYLHPLIAYSLHRSADFQALDREARGAFQAIRDQGEALEKQLTGQLSQARQIVEDVRKIAAEEGVSQQAIYFRDDAKAHADEAESWRKRTVQLAWGLGIYAVASLFIAKIPFLAPKDTYQSIQLGMSKVLIFAVISYMLYLSARNFLSHKHNAIVNKHRQNALMTYTALADAAADEENRQVVLTHASACIFTPQATGYSPDGVSDAAKATSIVEVLGRPLMKGS